MPSNTSAKAFLASESIQTSIMVVREQKVLLDEDLAKIYGVTTTRLNQQVRRNIHRFPKDFVFQLTQSETSNLMLQFATSRLGWGGRRKQPLAFTEHGAVMAACVLNSPIAVAASIHIVRAFVQLRTFLASHAELAKKIDELEKKYTDHDEQLTRLFETIRQLIIPPEDKPRRTIGFRLE